MSKFYGQVKGMAQTVASRRGSQFIKVSAQSGDGSIITRLWYDEDGNLTVDIGVADSSSFYGQSIFTGSLDELKTKLMN